MTTLNGMPVFEALPSFEKDIVFKYGSVLDLFDKPPGKHVGDFPDFKSTVIMSMTYETESFIEAMSIELFHDQVARGRQNSFWLPSWKSQIPVVGGLMEGAQTIRFPSVNYASTILNSQTVNTDWQTGRYIFLFDYVNPQLQYYKITNVSTAGGYDTITLDRPLAQSYTARKFMAGLLYMMRFGSDTLSGTWTSEGTTEYIIGFNEVVNFTPNAEPQTIINGYPFPGYLAPFDYAVLRYIWTDVDGRDLDTRTAFIGTGSSIDGETVGWAELSTVSDGAGHTLLTWGGDNTSPSGDEAVLINFKQAAIDFPYLGTLTLRMRAYWYGLKYDGNITVQFETYLGGTMNSFVTGSGQLDWTNVGGSVVQTINVARAVNDPVGTNVSGTDASHPGVELGTLIFNTVSKTASITSP